MRSMLWLRQTGWLPFLMESAANKPLLRCCKELYQNLKAVANEQSEETERRAGEMHAMLSFARMEDINRNGLPVFLARFLEGLRDLGDRVASDFLVPPAEA